MPLLEPAPEVHSPGERVLAAQESGSAPWAPELEGPGNTHTHTPARTHTHTHMRVSSQHPSLLHAHARRCTGREGPSSLEGIWPGGRQSGATSGPVPGVMLQEAVNLTPMLSVVTVGSLCAWCGAH